MKKKETDIQTRSTNRQRANEPSPQCRLVGCRRRRVTFSPSSFISLLSLLCLFHRASIHTHIRRLRVYRLPFVVNRAASNSYSRNTHRHTCKIRMAATTNTNTSTKVIRIQDDEKELLFQLREIYG
jgi:hypothetical protein